MVRPAHELPVPLLLGGALRKSAPERSAGCRHVRGALLGDSFVFGRPAPAIVVVSFFLACLPLTASAEYIWGNCQKGRGTWRHPDGVMETGIWQDGKLVVSKGRAEPVVPPKRRESHATSSSNGRASQRDPSRAAFAATALPGKGFAPIAVAAITRGRL